MKTLLKFAFPFLLAFCATSCGGDGPTDVLYKFEVADAPLAFNSEAGTKNIGVTAENVTWTASVDEDSRSWLSVTEETDYANVSVLANPDDDERIGTVTITPSGGEFSPVSVKVTQAGAGSDQTFRVTPPKLEFEAADNDPQTITVTVAEGLEWDFRIDEGAEGWISAERKGDTGIEVSVEDNTTEEELTGGITVWLTNLVGVPMKTVPVTQKGKTGGDLDPILRAAQREVTFTPESGQTRNVNVTAINVEWDFRVEGMTGNWMSVAKNPQGTQERLTFSTLEENETHDPRTAKVILYANGVEDFIIDVTQSGVPLPPIFELETDKIVLEAASDTYVINITAQSVEQVIQQWTRARSFMGPVEDWLTYTIAEDLSSLTLVPTSNTTTTPRYAQIWMRTDADLDDVCIEVFQKDVNGNAEIVDLTFDQISTRFISQYGTRFAVSLAVSTNGIPFTTPTSHQFAYDEDVNALGFIANLDFYTDRPVDSANPKLPAGEYYCYGQQTGNYYYAISTYDYSAGYTSSGLTYFGDDGDVITVSWSGDTVRIVFDGYQRARNIPTLFIYEGPWVLQE